MGRVLHSEGQRGTEGCRVLSYVPGEMFAFEWNFPPSIPTPALLLDLDVLESNLARMARRSRELGVALRPHVKTHKCVQIAERQRAFGAHGFTVSTLEEARVFAQHGFHDLTWAFPAVLARLEELAGLPRGVRLGLTVDSGEAIEAIESLERSYSVWLKVDCGYGRAGVEPQSEAGVELAAALAGSPRLEFAGILSHSGHAYRAASTSEIAAIAGQERELMVDFAARLRAAGIACPAVSVGSTPSMARVRHLTDVTEVRPGNYALHDYTQLRLGSCDVVDCALTVLASVVSSRPAAGRCVTDAGALALSKDAGPDDPVHFGRLLVDEAMPGSRGATCREPPES